jgi:colanic acid biosynthesis glycosyl transferase WcaI
LEVSPIMRIGIVCQYFPPEVAPIGVMVSELAQDLTVVGHEVTIFTGFPNHPRGEVFTGYHCQLRGQAERLMDGVTVRRNWLYITSSKSFFPRVLNYASFALSTLVSTIYRRQDVYLIISPPLSNFFIGVLLRLLGRRYVLNVQDIYPDAAVAAGVLRNPLLIDILKRIERIAYRMADTITVISKGFRSNLIAKEVPDDKLMIISNWINLDEIQPQPKINSFSVSHGIHDRFVVLYSGTIGLVSGAEIMTEVAHLLKDEAAIALMIVGEGIVKLRLQDEAKARKLNNIWFLPFQPRELLPELLSSASVGIVTLKPGHGGNSVPSKILGYLAAGRPVIASVDPASDTWAFVEEADCGICVPPGDEPALADAILQMSRNPELCRRLGQNGRTFLEKNLSRTAVTKLYEAALCRQR